MKVSASPCPCQSGKSYHACCESYITGERFPSHPEPLMRSRYTAYTQVNIPYIMETMRGKPLEGLDPKKAHEWASQVEWHRLDLIREVISDETPEVGFVEFKAHYHIRNKPHVMHENSEFHRIDGRWYYVGDVSLKKITVVHKEKKIGRNDPCLCGSGKKYKNCCLA